MVKIIVGGRPRSAKRSIKIRLCSFVGAFPCSRVPPDTILVDFWLDLGWVFKVFQSVLIALFWPNLPHPQKNVSEHLFATPWAQNLQ